MDIEGEGTWKVKGEGAVEHNNPLSKYFTEHGDDQEKAMIKTFPEKVTMGDIVKEVSKYENEAAKYGDLVFQNVFLGMCATYKFCLWLFCMLYAVPKSGSNVLVALAADKRNDFCVTGTMILVTSVAW